MSELDRTHYEGNLFDRIAELARRIEELERAVMTMGAIGGAEGDVGTGGVTDHGKLGGLLDDDHTNLVHVDIARTVVAVHEFDPASAGAPFTMGTNAANQRVIDFLGDFCYRMVQAGVGVTGGGQLTADVNVAVDQAYAFVWTALHTFAEAQSEDYDAATEGWRLDAGTREFCEFNGALVRGRLHAITLAQGETHLAAGTVHLAAGGPLARTVTTQ